AGFAVAGDVAEERVLPRLEVDLELVGLPAAGRQLEARHFAAVEHERVHPTVARELDGVDTGRGLGVLGVEEEVAALDVERRLRRALRLLVARPATPASAAARGDDRGRRDPDGEHPDDTTSVHALPHPTLTVACMPAARWPGMVQ